MIHITHTPPASLARRRIKLMCQCSFGVAVAGLCVATVASQSVILNAESSGCNFTGVTFYAPKQENQQRNAELPPPPPLNQPELPMLPRALPEALGNSGELTLLTEPESEAELQLGTNEDALLQQPSPQPPQKIAARGADSSYTPPDYLDCPEPPYPPQLRQRRISGCLEVLISVSSRGLPTEVEITKSSGNQQLDRHAINWILKHWTFRPACRGTNNIAAQVRTQLSFSLQF